MNEYNPTLLKIVLLFIWTSVILKIVNPFFGINFLGFIQNFLLFLVVFFGAFLLIDFLIKNTTQEKK